MKDGNDLKLAQAEQRLKTILESFRLALSAEDFKALLPSDTVTTLTGMTEKGLERRRALGLGPPFVHVGRLVRYPITELAKWLLEGDAESGPTLLLPGESISMSPRRRDVALQVLVSAIEVLDLRGELSADG